SPPLTGGVTLGPIISGLLLEHFWWGSVFLINLPAMFLLLVTAPFLLPESKGTRSARFDWLSSLLALASVIPVIAGIKSVAADGWSTSAGVYAAVGLAVGVTFVRRQLSAEV